MAQLGNQNSQKLIGWPQSVIQKMSKVATNKIVVFVFGFALISSVVIIYTKAQSLSASIEVENGLLSGNATVISDSSASMGKALVFNSSPTSASPYKIKTWAPQFQGFGTTGTATDFHPEKFNIVIGNHNIRINGMSVADSVASLRTKGIPVLIYLNGSFNNQQDLGPNGNDPTHNSRTLYPDSSYAKTSSGSRITENDFGNNVLMNPIDTTWRNSLYKKCNYYFGQATYNGCFFDTIGTAPVASGYVSPGVPVNPSTGQLWTDTTWLDAMNANVINAKSHLSGKLLYGNGLANGSRYYTVTNKLMSSLDAAMAEQFVMPKDSGPNDSETNWKKNVDMLLDAQTRHKPILAETKAWDSASRAIKDSRHKYALATFLLGSNSYTYFNFQYDHTTTSPSTWHSWWGTDYGQPSGAYFKHSSGVYIRNFAKAKAVVNPSPTATITYNLGATYKKLGTATGVTSITLGPRSAEIFVK